MLRHKTFARALAFVLVASFLCAVVGRRSRVSAQQAGAQQQQQQQPARTQKPARPDETIDEDDVERVETDLTNVLFTAVDRDKRFVTTIKQEDIRVLEDGVEQKVFTFQRETARPLSLAILIDTSASEERTLPEEKSAAQRFVDSVIRQQKDEVAVLSFTGDATLEQGLTGNSARVRRAIDRVEFQPPSGYIGGGVMVGTPPINGDSRAGSTAIWDAIWVTSREVLSETSDKTRRAIILLTDGEDTSSRLKLNEAVDSALRADAIIYAIGIGDNYFDGVDKGVLNKISERTGGRAYFPRNEEDLRVAFAQIQDELRSQYLVAYSPTNKAKDGTFRQVKIEVTNPELGKQKLRLTYRQGYFARSAVDARSKAK
ncbi:MAG TPA: VWA domain-containing protein [Pyrinomonadaceae bacterium]|jgi:VWFA-related protein|nr:VWA domain-containing protein [Pyrinomonadaceae bacterium]